MEKGLISKYSISLYGHTFVLSGKNINNYLTMWFDSIMEVLSDKSYS